MYQRGIVPPQSVPAISTYGATQKSSPSPRIQPNDNISRSSNRACYSSSGLNARRSTKLHSKSPDRVSIRGSRSNLRPNFSAVKIPHSKIRDDEDDGEVDDNDENAKPSNEFVADGRDSGEEDEEEDAEQVTGSENGKAEKDADDELKESVLGQKQPAPTLPEANKAGLKEISRRAIWRVDREVLIQDNRL